MDDKEKKELEILRQVIQELQYGNLGNVVAWKYYNELKNKSQADMANLIVKYAVEEAIETVITVNSITGGN